MYYHVSMELHFNQILVLQEMLTVILGLIFVLRLWALALKLNANWIEMLVNYSWQLGYHTSLVGLGSYLFQ